MVVEAPHWEQAGSLTYCAIIDGLWMILTIFLILAFLGVCAYVGLAPLWFQRA